MARRRFVLLAAVLATLNVALWVAPAGLALRRVVIQELFGPKLVRAQVLEKSPVGGSTIWGIDRGVVTSASGSQLTLREADGKVQTIPVSGSTRVIRLATGRRLPLSVLAPGWRVLVTWPASGPAQSVDVERVPIKRSQRLAR
jgi:hypothetical protein